MDSIIGKYKNGLAAVINPPIDICKRGTILLLCLFDKNARYKYIPKFITRLKRKYLLRPKSDPINLVYYERRQFSEAEKIFI